MFREGRCPNTSQQILDFHSALVGEDGNPYLTLTLLFLENVSAKDPVKTFYIQIYRFEYILKLYLVSGVADSYDFYNDRINNSDRQFPRPWISRITNYRANLSCSSQDFYLSSMLLSRQW